MEIRLIRALAAVALLLALGFPSVGFAAPAPPQSVFVVMKNETGQSLHSFSLDYGTGKFNYDRFDRGLTHGGFVKVRGRQPLSCSFKTKAGTPHQFALERPLTADMDGGIFIVHLKPEGRAEYEYSAGSTSSAPAAGLPVAGVTEAARQAAASSEGRLRPLIVLAALVGVPLLAFLFLRGLIGLPSRVINVLKKAFTNPVLNELKARLKLVPSPCPIMMYSGESSAGSWCQGTLDGRMLGMDNDRIWLGGEDEDTLFHFERLEPGAAPPEGFFRIKGYSGFCGSDSFTPDFPFLRHEALLAGLPSLSPAVTTVGIFATAIQATVDWSEAQTDAILADLGILASILDAIDGTRPPLLVAIGKRDFAQALSLIDQGADVNSSTLDHVDALTAAAGAGNLELVVKLVDRGAKLKGKYQLPLQAAAAAGHLDILTFLLDRGLPVDTGGQQKWTALMEAADHCQEPAVRLLLSRGASTSIEDREGSTALSAAENGGHAGIIALLQKAVS